MLSIVDNSVRDEVFGVNQSPAGKFFFDWLNSGKGTLVAGGSVLKELDGAGTFKKWFAEALRLGRARRITYDKMDIEVKKLENQAVYQSDDPHVLALALVSGARLLFSNDQLLQKDFKNPKIINSGKGRGRVYSTSFSKDVSSTHRSLLR